jgi:hypothetical protein
VLKITIMAGQRADWHDFNAENRGLLAQNGTRLNFASTASQLGHDVP